MAILGHGILPYRDINVQVSESSYTFASPSSPDAPSLILDRPTGDIRLGNAALSSGARPHQVMSIAGILGIIQLRLDKYVVAITKTRPVGRIRGHMVYRVTATQILPMRRQQMRDPDEDAFMSLLRTFLKDAPLFFSYSLDITNSLQRQSQADTSLPLWQRADDRFFFNRFLQSDLIAFREHGVRGQTGAQTGVDPFILPVIFGLFEIRPTTFSGTPLTFAIVSRRARTRVGTRYFTRGLDAEGNAANFNETEQIIVINDSGSGMDGFAGGSANAGGDGATRKAGGAGREMQTLAYVQTRGSVPAYWAEINHLKYVPKLQIRNIDAGVPAARAHLAEQIRLYGDNYLVNLVNQKGREKRVKETYERTVEAISASPNASRGSFTPTGSSDLSSEKMLLEYARRVHYVYFDFHAETKGLRMDRAYNLVERLRTALDEQGYFHGVDLPASSIGGSRSNSQLDARRLQSSVVRTNCMDCLDRTNVMQSMFARDVLDRQLIDLGLLSPGSNFRTADPAFEFLFRNVWADNADAVSGAYAGTGAMKTDITRTGVRTRGGALRDASIGATRYLKNNFFDGPRQDAFDLFLGNYLPGATGIGGGSVFADRRPLLIQAVPYLLAFSAFMVLVGLVSGNTATMSLRIFVFFFAAVTAWSFYFIWTHGMLYVNWPKLNPRPFATEGYNEHLTKASKDALIGPLVSRHERGASIARYLSAEEGKKRIE